MKKSLKRNCFFSQWSNRIIKMQIRNKLLYGMWHFLLKKFKQSLSLWLSPMDQTKWKVREKSNEQVFEIIFLEKLKVHFFSLLNKTTSNKLYIYIFSTQNIVVTLSNTDITLSLLENEDYQASPLTNWIRISIFDKTFIQFVCMLRIETHYSTW